MYRSHKKKDNVWFSPQTRLFKINQSQTYLLAGQDVLSQLHFAEGALAERLDQHIVPNRVLRLALRILATTTAASLISASTAGRAIVIGSIRA